MEKLFLLKFAACDRSDIEMNENIFPVEILLLYQINDIVTLLSIPWEQERENSYRFRYAPHLKRTPADLLFRAFAF